MSPRPFTSQGSINQGFRYVKPPPRPSDYQQNTNIFQTAPDQSSQYYHQTVDAKLVSR